MIMEIETKLHLTNKIKNKMKIMLLLASLFSTYGLQAQYTNFEQTVRFIQKKIYCCSVPFAASTNRKVDSIAIEKNGNISLFYSDNKPKQTFNLFNLHKEDAETNSIDTILGGKFIQFYVNAERVRLIRFATAADAKEVYNAFLQLIKISKKEIKMFGDLNFQQTVDVINIILSKWSEKGNPVTVVALKNGSIIIANKRNQSLRFNLFDIIDSEDDKMVGIETIGCNPRAHALLAWINFKSVHGTVAFIRLDCSTPKSELELIRGAFLHLRSLCTKFNASYKRPRRK